MKFVTLLMTLTIFSTLGCKANKVGIRNKTKENSTASNRLNGDSPQSDLCESVKNELPLYTHYNKSKRRFEFEGVDAAALPAGYTPRLDAYWGDRFDVISVSNDEANKFSNEICLRTGNRITFIRAKEKGVRNAIVDSVTIIHGIIVNGSIIHLILPMGWKENPARKYPILAFSHYTANATLFSEQGKLLVESISKASAKNGTIGFVWNGGASYGVTQNPKALKQFSDIINYIAKNFSGDRENIALFGGSRGGGASLALASNFKRYPYNFSWPTVYFDLGEYECR